MNDVRRPIAIDLVYLDQRVRVRKTQEAGRISQVYEVSGVHYIEVITDQQRRRWPLSEKDIEALE